MTANEYLRSILDEAKIGSASQELANLRARREEVEAALRDGFSQASPCIKYGGSKAKGTMVKASYDLDLTCYFACDDNAAGNTLDEIYANTKTALELVGYGVVEKTSAIRIHSGSVDFHVDVVPGRFFDDTKTDVWLHRTQGDKKRMKTNPDVHIDHVRASGVRDAICLMKLWRSRIRLTSLRTFAIELLTIKILEELKSQPLDVQMQVLFETLEDQALDIAIQDPANPGGNDLSEVFAEDVRRMVKSGSANALFSVKASGWEAVFGPLQISAAARTSALAAAAATTTFHTKPWSSR
jgi:hypothetical protein